MKRRTGIVCMIIGAVLIASALLLLLYNRSRDSEAGRAVESLMPELRQAIDEKQSGAPEGESARPSAGDGEPSGEQQPDIQTEGMVTTLIDGDAYIGYLSIPALKLELPVIAEWSDARLKTAPCRQFGSTWGDDLVIAGHNYKQHFGRLHLLEKGDALSFTDMDGETISYTVKLKDTVMPEESEAVKNSGYDLALYTCTYSGSDRVVIFCDRADG